jgi:hypothetical protein
VGLDGQHPGPIQPPAREAHQARPYVLGERGRAGHVEAQLYRRGQLIDVLTPGAR